MVRREKLPLTKLVFSGSLPGEVAKDLPVSLSHMLSPVEGTWEIWPLTRGVEHAWLSEYG